MNVESIRTQKLLSKVSRRLSGRAECAKVEFILSIGYKLKDPGAKHPVAISESSYIYFYPDVYVYRDKHHRKDKDLYRITDFICHKYFPEIVIDRDKYGQLKIDTAQLVSGVYKYQLSVDGKRRRWVKLYPSR